MTEDLTAVADKILELAEKASVAAPFEQDAQLVYTSYSRKHAGAVAQGYKSLEAENLKLREALVSIANYRGVDMLEDGQRGLDKCRATAMVALGFRKTGQGKWVKAALAEGGGL